MKAYPQLKEVFDMIKQYIPLVGTKVCTLMQLCNSTNIDNSIIDH